MEYTFDDVIGTYGKVARDARGRPLKNSKGEVIINTVKTKTLRVYLDKNGNVKNAYPVAKSN